MSEVLKNKEQFWGETPCILFEKKHLLLFFPDEQMSIEEKLNTITRFTIYISIILAIYSNKLTYILTEIVILIIIYLYYYQNYSYDIKNSKTNIRNNTSDIKIIKPNSVNLNFKKIKEKKKSHLSKLYNDLAEGNLPNYYPTINNTNGDESIHFAKWLYT